MDDAPDVLVTASERTGILHPANLGAYAARRRAPAAAAAEVVDTYWSVRWELPPTRSIHQRMVDLPAVTLTVEQGDVVAPAVVTGVHRKAWERTIRGSGEVFGVRLRPAGLAVLSGLDPVALVDTTLPVTPEVDPLLHRLLADVARQDTFAGRARAMDAVIAARLADTPLRPLQVLANTVLRVLVETVRNRAVPVLAEELGTTERAMQRALRQTLGIGPKAALRRVRLQEVARLLAADDGPDLATLAADLGYADQAHLTRDFRAVAGIGPAGYRAEVRGGGPSG